MSHLENRDEIVQTRQEQLVQLIDQLPTDQTSYPQDFCLTIENKAALRSLVESHFFSLVPEKTTELDEDINFSFYAFFKNFIAILKEAVDFSELNVAEIEQRSMTHLSQDMQNLLAVFYFVKIFEKILYKIKAIAFFVKKSPALPDFPVSFLNRLAYCHENPENFLDSLDQYSQKIGMIVGGTPKTRIFETPHPTVIIPRGMGCSYLAKFELKGQAQAGERTQTSQTNDSAQFLSPPLPSVSSAAEALSFVTESPKEGGNVVRVDAVVQSASLGGSNSDDDLDQMKASRTEEPSSQSAETDGADQSALLAFSLSSTLEGSSNDGGSRTGSPLQGSESTKPITIKGPDLPLTESIHLCEGELLKQLPEQLSESAKKLDASGGRPTSFMQAARSARRNSSDADDGQMFAMEL